MAKQDVFAERVGSAEALPPFDVFGNRRAAGCSTRHIGSDRVVVYPAGAGKELVERAIQEIKDGLKRRATGGRKQDDNKP